MNKNYTVGQYLTDRLYELGLEHLFSIAGDYTIDWINDYVEPSRIRVIEEVNELNAGFAADGYARLKGIGALCVTYSAGALSAVNAIAGAYVEKVPVVLINGTPSIKKTLTYEQTGVSAHHFISGRETDLQVFEYITSACVRLDNPDLAPMLIDYALTRCLTERRPVYIELLQDMIDLECEPPKRNLTPARAVPDPENLSEAVSIIKEKLEQSNNPLIWVGVEVDRYGLQAQTETLIKELNIPFVSELLSKAVLTEDNPLFAGVFDGKASSANVQDLVSQSDFILALGVWLTDINYLGEVPDFSKTLYASFDTIKYGTYFSPQVPLRILIENLVAQTITCKPQLPLQLPAHKIPDMNPTDPITYQGFYDFISAYIDKNTIIGSDASLNYFGSLLVKVDAPRGCIVQSSYSAIGYGAPAATGICLAKKDNQRVIIFSGDGGFQMGAQCLSTQTRFQLNPVIFVINNGIYGVEQWLADASVFHNPDKPIYKSCLLHPWNYSKLSEVFGCRGWKAGTYGELTEAVTGALANTSSPSVIDVVIPARSIPENAGWKTN